VGPLARRDPAGTGDAGRQRLIVPIVELLNSAIEANVNRVGLERHELSGRAKDIASTAVFLSIAFAATIWGLITDP